MRISNKTKTRIVLPLIAGIIVLLFGGLFTFFKSEESYKSEITWWNIDANLQSNGDLHIVDTIKFESNGFHFFEYEIGYAKNIIQGIGNQSSFDYDSIKVSVYNQDGYYYFKDQSQESLNSESYLKYDDCLGFSWNYRAVEDGGRPLYYYTYGQNKELIYVYLHNGLDNVIYFQYEYVIKNALNKYQDVSELNWNFASPLEEIGVKNVQLTLRLPTMASSYEMVNEIDQNKIMVFGHGNVQSEIVSLENNIIKTKTSRLLSSLDDKLEIRVIIPNKIDIFGDVLEKNIIQSNSSGFEILKAEEMRLKSIDDELIRMYFLNKNLLVYGNLAISITIILIAIFMYYKYDKERKPIFDHEYLREPPSKLSPSELSYLMNEKEIVTEAFSATLISLIRKKYLLIDSNGSLLTDDNANYRISINKDGSQKEVMNEDEKFVYNLLFNNLFKESFTMDDLEATLRVNSSASIYTNSIYNWKRTSVKNAAKLKYYDSLYINSIFSIFGVVAIVLSFYTFLRSFILYSLPFGYILFILVSVMLGVFIIQYSLTINRKSKIGIEEYTKWNAFKKFLTDFSHFEDYDMMSVIVWEEYLVYASVLGIASLVEKQIRIKLDKISSEEKKEIQMRQPNFFDIYYIIYLNRISTRFSFTQSLARQTMIAAKAAAAGKAVGKMGGGFGGSSSFGGGGHGGRAG